LILNELAQALAALASWTHFTHLLGGVLLGGVLVIGLRSFRRRERMNARGEVLA